MSQTVQSNPEALIENIARNLPPSVQDDFRNLLSNVVLANLTAQAPGGNLIQIGGAQQGSSAAPVGVNFTVAGANGAFSVAFIDPSTAKPNTIWHELSYSTIVSFTKNVTTMAPTTNSTANVPAPGQSYFFRIRSSFDKKTWSPYQLLSTTAVDAGLVEATAMTPAAAFNQSNFAEVNSVAAGAGAQVTISGTGGLLTSYSAVRGTTQGLRPSATIVGVIPGSEQFVGWDGKSFQLKPTLAGVLADNLEPVGKASVVTTAPPTLPIINPIIAGGGVVGYDVVFGGSGASQDYNLAVSDPGGPGTGATPGAQTIVGGVLISVGPGNAGHLYDGSTIVTASGGSGGSGPTGGGTAVGGNGARMTAV